MSRSRLSVTVRSLLFGWVSSAAACVVPIVGEAEDGEGLGSGVACLPDEPDACGVGLKCHFAPRLGEEEWSCASHGRALRAGDRCGRDIDCGPGLACTEPRPHAECITLGGHSTDRACDTDTDCAADAVCSLQRIDFVCAPTCTDDLDCEDGQHCESFAAIRDGRSYPGVITACTSSSG